MIRPAHVDVGPHRDGAAVLSELGERAVARPTPTAVADPASVITTASAEAEKRRGRTDAQAREMGGCDGAGDFDLTEAAKALAQGIVVHTEL